MPLDCGLPSIDDVSPVFDASLFCGNYPYRKLPGGTPESLGQLVAGAKLSGAVLTPFESIFYRQPLEGLKPWLETEMLLPFNPLYWLVVNPLLPGWEKDLAAADFYPAIVGLRLLPRYQGYGLDHPALADVVAVAAASGLPLNLTARLLDDRLHPYQLRVDAPLEMSAVEALVRSSAGAKWVLSFFTMAELAGLAPVLAESQNVYVDIGCAKPFEFWGDDIRVLGPLSQMIYGTGAPLYYHLGNRISLERAGFSESGKHGILSGNLQRLLSGRAGEVAVGQ